MVCCQRMQMRCDFIPWWPIDWKILCEESCHKSKQVPFKVFLSHTHCLTNKKCKNTQNSSAILKQYSFCNFLVSQKYVYVIVYYCRYPFNGSSNLNIKQNTNLRWLNDWFIILLSTLTIVMVHGGVGHTYLVHCKKSNQYLDYLISIELPSTSLQYINIQYSTFEYFYYILQHISFGLLMLGL